MLHNLLHKLHYYKYIHLSILQLIKFHFLIKIYCKYIDSEVAITYANKNLLEKVYLLCWQ